MTIVILLIITVIIGIIIIIITMIIMICNNLGVIRDTLTVPGLVMRLCERVNTGEHGAWCLRCRHYYTHSTLALG